MSRAYKFRDQQKLYFVSFATVNWIDVFTRRIYKDILLDSFRYCIMVCSKLRLRLNLKHALKAPGRAFFNYLEVSGLVTFTVLPCLNCLIPSCRKAWNLSAFRS
jgi:hypothetical protein